MNGTENALMSANLLSLAALSNLPSIGVLINMKRILWIDLIRSQVSVVIALPPESKFKYKSRQRPPKRIRNARKNGEGWQNVNIKRKKKHLHNHQKTMGEYICQEANWKGKNIFLMSTKLLSRRLRRLLFVYILNTRRWFRLSHTCCDDMKISFLLYFKSIFEGYVRWNENSVCLFILKWKSNFVAFLRGA